jgi:hypothetical protein
MTHFAKEEGLPLEEGLRLYAGRLQLWRLCCNAACRRAHSCRGDPQRCGTRFADWGDTVKKAAQEEYNSRDPHTQFLIAALKEKIVRLGQAITDQA